MSLKRDVLGSFSTVLQAPYGGLLEQDILSLVDKLKYYRKQLM